MRKGFLIFILLLSQVSFANETAPTPAPSASPTPTSTTDDESPKDSWADRMIENNIEISNWFDGVAEGVDLFLAGKQLTKRKNKSKLRLEEAIRFVEGQEFTHDFTLGVVLQLPNVEEYWQVKFTSYDELEDRRQAQSDYLRRGPRPENYGASIGLFRKLGNVRVAFQPRVQLQNPISVSHSLSFESVAEMKSYSINPKLEFYAVADKGTGVFWALNFNYYINKKYSLTFINNGDYVAQIHTESVTNGFAFQHVITDHTAISYGTNFFSNNRERYHLEGFSFFTTWSQTVYKNILDFSVTPHWDFFRDLNWHGRGGLALNLGVSF